jgi:hypothetical protein
VLDGLQQEQLSLRGSISGFKMEVEKLQLLSKILCAIPCNEGENLISFGYVSLGFNYFTIQCLLNWKCDKRYYDCASVDEAIDRAHKLHEEILGYPYSKD